MPDTPAYRVLWTKMTRQDAEPKGRRPAFLKFRSSVGVILITVMMAWFTDVFLYGLILPVIPFELQMADRVKEKDVQFWVSIMLAVYGGATFVTSPIVGYWADRSSSRRVPFVAGLLAFAAATALLCFGKSVAVMVVGRAFQGVSGAMVSTVGLAMLVDTVSDDALGRTMGSVMLAITLGTTTAPVIGGVVYAKAGYYWVYGIAFILLGFDIILRLIMIEKKTAAKWTEEGYSEAEHAALLGSSAYLSGERRAYLTSIEQPNRILRVNEMAQGPLGDSTESSPYGTILSEADRPVSYETKPKRSSIWPMFKSPRFLTALWGTVAFSIITTAFITVLPVHAKYIFHFNPTQDGLILLPILVPSLLSPGVGWVCDRYGTRWPATIGALLAVPFLVCLRFVTHGSKGQLILLCVLLACIGLCEIFQATPLMPEIALSVEEVEAKRASYVPSNGTIGQAYGAYVAAYALGALLGPLWVQLTQTHGGWSVTAWSLGLLSGVTSIATFAFSGDRHKKIKEQPRYGLGASMVEAPH